MDAQKPSPISQVSKLEIPVTSGKGNSTVTIEADNLQTKKHKNRLRRSQILLGLTLTLLVLLTVSAVGFLANQIKKLKQKAQLPSSYQECTQAKESVIQESYPSVCVTKAGVRFLQPLTEEEQKKLNPPDDTSNWKIYTNEKYNYSVKYPDSIEPVEDTNDEKYLNIVTFGSGDVDKESYSVKVSNKNLEEEIEFYRSLTDFPPFSKLLNEEYIDIFGLKGYRFDSDPQIPDQGLTSNPRTSIIISNNKFIYIINSRTENIDQILSTFKFLPDTSNWKIYTDKDLKFTLKYPPLVILDNQFKESVSNLTLSIEVQSYEQVKAGEETSSNYNMGYDSETFKKDVESLKIGRYGEPVDFGYQESRKVINLGRVNAKSFVVLGRFDTCDVTFERKAIFYPDDNHRLILTLFAPDKTIIEEGPSYFQQRGDQIEWVNCEEPSNLYGMERYYKDLIAASTSPTSQKWYSLFDQILSTFKFTE